MKLILKLLARLYPSEWRARYGTEYEALLEERTPRAADLWDVFWSATKMRITARSLVRIALPSSLAGALAAAVIFATIPTQYASQVLIKGIVSKAAPAEHAEKFNPRLGTPFSNEFLGSVIQKRNLYSADRARMSIEDVIRKMNRSVKFKGGPIAPGEGDHTIGWIIEFDYPDPVVAQQVAGDLTQRLMEWNLKYAETEAAAGYPRSAESLMTIRAENEPNLPQTPEGLTQFQFIAIGLLTGSIIGLVLAATLGSRSEAPTANA